MKSTEEHPLAFFDWYLEIEISKYLKKFYKHKMSFKNLLGTPFSLFHKSV